MISSAALTICSSVSVGGLPRFALPESAAVFFAVISALHSVVLIH
jgi:hypothetical protein